MKRVSYSAPGKIILSGEHSVVYGKPAFVTAVAYRLTVTVTESKTRQIDPELEKAVTFIEELVLKHLAKKGKTALQPFSLHISSDIPRGRGMGSSAAFCVALVGALMQWYTGEKAEKQTINTLAYKGETYFHGMPSGVDVSASCQGGLIFYRKEFEFLKCISALAFKIPQNIQKSLFLVDSGKPLESTAEMVAHVGTRYNENSKDMEQTLIAIEKCTKRMVISIVKEDPVMFAETIAENQKLLIDFGIVSAQTHELLDRLSAYGIGKVTGAGGLREGSGMILFYATDAVAFQSFLQKESLWYTPFKQDFEGGQYE